MIKVDYLLDTHAVLWALTDPHQLGTSAQEVIRDPSNGLVVSAVSAWELATKHRLGKLPQADVLVVGFARHVARLGARALPVCTDHALLAGSLDWDHRDPFDRMLVAQAQVERLTLVTRDERLSRYDVRILAA